MATNYIIENHRLRETKPVFNRAWCKPANLMLFGLDERAIDLEVCSQEWRIKIDRLIDQLQREILSLNEQGKGGGGASAEKIKETRDRLRDLYAIESQCCV